MLDDSMTVDDSSMYWTVRFISGRGKSNDLVDSGVLRSKFLEDPIDGEDVDIEERIIPASLSVFSSESSTYALGVGVCQSPSDG